MEHWVSPRFKESKLASGSLEDKIDVFEDQWRGWILDHANGLLGATYGGSSHSGLAVLMIVTSYFETFACFLHGKSSEGKSLEFFACGFREVFPFLPEKLREGNVRDPDTAIKNIEKALYGEVRCGLFHQAMVRGRVAIDPFLNGPLQYAVDRDTGLTTQITVNPMLVVWGVTEHFNGYVKRLRNPDETKLREKFERFWDMRPLHLTNRPRRR